MEIRVPRLYNLTLRERRLGYETEATNEVPREDLSAVSEGFEGIKRQDLR